MIEQANKYNRLIHSSILKITAARIAHYLKEQKYRVMVYRDQNIIFADTGHFDLLRGFVNRLPMCRQKSNMGYNLT